MPLFYVDTDDGTVHVHDDEGIEVADFAAARNAAISALPDMARDKLPDGEHRIFVATVRDHAGTILYAATLTFRGQRMPTLA